MKKTLLKTGIGLIAMFTYQLIINDYYFGIVCGASIAYTWQGIDEYIK